MTQFYKKKDKTSSEEVEDKKYRHFMILLYPEWGNFQQILGDLKGSFKNYAYIKHIPESDEKKEHIHFILSLDNARTIKSLSRRIDVPENLIRNCKSLRASCRYLIHIDDEDKYQYNLDQVIVSHSFKSTYFKSFDDLLSDEEILDNIYTFVDSYKELNSIELEINLTRYVCENGFERVFKRYYSTICKYIAYISDTSGKNARSLVNIIYIIYKC